MLNQLDYIRDCLRKGRFSEAVTLAVKLSLYDPQSIDVWILLGRAYVGLRNYGLALTSVQRALAIDPAHPAALLVSIEAKLGLGLVSEAIAAAKSLERDRNNDGSVVLQVGYCYTRTNRHADAARCYERVLALQPNNNGVLHNLAGAKLALGELDRAEQLYDELLRREPQACETYYNRAVVRKQTQDRNHIAEMEKVLAGIRSGGWGESPVCYALAKEFEDLGEWKRSIDVLTRGAAARHKQSSYKVTSDIAVMQGIQRSFDKTFCEQPSTGYSAERQIFVLGMPRTGTTLVDRILSSHSLVGSVGECDEFSRALERQAPGKGTVFDTTRLAAMDWEKVGREYCHAVTGILPEYSIRLDKTLTNFLYVGAILQALPDARIIHLRRNAMDTCYAIYKTLFRAGFEYSYDLEALGQYYLSYRRLMAHWEDVLPNRFLTIDYEDLVGDQERMSRQLVEFCGLEWEDACLSFEKNVSPSLTASVAQVRTPVYATSVRLWRRYETEMAPLRRILEQGGCPIE